MSNELLPCPFCGAEPMLRNNGYGPYGFIQHKSRCFIPDFVPCVIAESEFTAWNTRAERTCENIDAAESQGYFTCSVCQVESSTDYCHSGWGIPNFCPSCGAKVVNSE